MTRRASARLALNDHARQHVLMVGERISRDSSLKEARWIRVLSDRTEVEYPVVLAMSVIKEFLRVLPSIPVEAFDAGRGVAHDDDVVCHIDEIELDVEMFIFESGFAS